MIKKSKIKSFRKAFNLYALIGGIALMAVMGQVAVPGIQNMFTKFKVNEIAEKEAYIKDLYESYYKGVKLDAANNVNTIDRLLDQAILDKVVPQNFNKDKFIKNGLEGKLSFSPIDNDGDNIADGISITSGIPLGNKFALAAYRGTLVGEWKANGIGEDEDGNPFHSYMLDLTDEEKEKKSQEIAKTYNIGKNYAARAANSSKLMSATERDAMIASSDGPTDTQKGQEYYEYDPVSGVYDVYTWSEEDGEFIATSKKTTGEANSKGEYIVDSLDDLDKSTMEIGSVVTVIDEYGTKEYTLSTSGEWVEKTVIAKVKMDLPLEISFFKELLDRSGSNEYFKSPPTSTTTVTELLWGAPVAFTRFSNYWRSDSDINIIDYTNRNGTTQGRIFISETLNDLPTTRTQEDTLSLGDVAFLVTTGGYKGVQGKGNNDFESLYPEAVFDGTNWIYFTPNIGDILRLGFANGHYWSYDIGKLLLKGGMKNGFAWWGDVANTVRVTTGSRIDMPDMDNDDSTVETYLTVSKLEIGFTSEGIKSQYYYDMFDLQNPKLLEWTRKTRNDDHITNNLVDIARGEEFVTNTRTKLDEQSQSHILKINDAGDFLVAWKSDYAYSAVGSKAVFGQLYDKDGVAKFSTIKIDIDASKNNEISLAKTEENKFVVTWIGKDNNVYVRKYTVTLGSVTPSITELVNTNSENAIDPQVVGLKDKGFVVAWAGEVSNFGYEILAKTYDANGGFLNNDDLRVNSGGAGTAEFTPQLLAMTENSGFVVTWVADANGEVKDAGTDDEEDTTYYHTPKIKFRSFSHNGTATTANLLLESYQANRPRLSISSDSTFTITYSLTRNNYRDKDTDGNELPMKTTKTYKYAIYAKTFNQEQPSKANGEYHTLLLSKRDGTPPLYSKNYKNSEIKQLNDGNVAIVWQGEEVNTIMGGIYSVNADKELVVVKERFAINDVTSTNDKKELPNIAVLEDQFLVTWQGQNIDSEKSGIAANLFKNDGTLIQPDFEEFLVNTKIAGDQSYLNPLTVKDYANLNNGANPDSKDDDTWTIYQTPTMNCATATTGNNFALTWTCDAIDGNNKGISTRVYGQGHIKFMEWARDDN